MTSRATQRVGSPREPDACQSRQPGPATVRLLALGRQLAELEARIDEPMLAAAALLDELRMIRQGYDVSPDALRAMAGFALGRGPAPADPACVELLERIAWVREQLADVPEQARAVGKHALQIALAAPTLASLARYELAKLPVSVGRDTAIVETVGLPIALKRQAEAIRARAPAAAARATRSAREIDRWLAAIERAPGRVPTQELPAVTT